jgi:hypothetical protein
MCNRSFLRAWRRNLVGTAVCRSGQLDQPKPVPDSSRLTAQQKIYRLINSWHLRNFKGCGLNTATHVIICQRSEYRAAQ